MKRNITWTRRSRDPSSTPLIAPQNGENQRERTRRWGNELGNSERSGARYRLHYERKRMTVSEEDMREEEENPMISKARARRIIKIYMYKHCKVLTIIVFTLSNPYLCDLCYCRFTLSVIFKTSLFLCFVSLKKLLWPEDARPGETAVV